MFFHLVTTVLMAAAASSQSPIACNLKALTVEERAQHAALGGKLRGAIVSRQDLPEGLAFQLDPSRLSLMELARWVDAERRCCPFLDFRISLEREGAGLQLALSGRPGVKEFLLKDLVDYMK